jgi:hypothetical protein
MDSKMEKETLAYKINMKLYINLLTLVGAPGAMELLLYKLLTSNKSFFDKHIFCTSFMYQLQAKLISITADRNIA